MKKRGKRAATVVPDAPVPAATARRGRHPAVVSRLRLAQRFGRRELKDVPHA
jgi:hypothetical protein